MITLARNRPEVFTWPWLRSLRWTAVLGQTVTVLWVQYGLGINLPLNPIFIGIGLTALTNLVLHTIPRGRGETPPVIAACLATDVLLLTALLHLTGGPHNPFSTFYLAHIALAAVALPPRWTALIAGICCAGYGFLFLGRNVLPLPGDVICGVGPSLPLRLHLQGMFTAFVLTAGAIVFFAGRLQAALRRREGELAVAQSVAAQHERFAALATLAAGAAHELGTPLGTISIAAGEVARAAQLLPNQLDLADDALLIHEEAARCRAILDRLQAQSGDAPREVSLSKLAEELRSRFPDGLTVQIQVQVPAVFAPPEALLQALSSLIKNGLDASPGAKPVHCQITGDADAICFAVTNEGADLTADVIAHAGEPFFTTKPPGRGTGLGLFLVRLLAERFGGTFHIESLGGITTATLKLPNPPTTP